MRTLLRNPYNPRDAPLDAVYDRQDGVLMHEAEHTGKFARARVTIQINRKPSETYNKAYIM